MNWIEWKLLLLSSFKRSRSLALTLSHTSFLPAEYGADTLLWGSHFSSPFMVSFCRSRVGHTIWEQTGGGVSLCASVCKRRMSRECPVLLSICRAEQDLIHLTKAHVQVWNGNQCFPLLHWHFSHETETPSALWKRGVWIVCFQTRRLHFSIIKIPIMFYSGHSQKLNMYSLSGWEKMKLRP